MTYFLPRKLVTGYVTSVTVKICGQANLWLACYRINTGLLKVKKSNYTFGMLCTAVTSELQG